MSGMGKLAKVAVLTLIFTCCLASAAAAVQIGLVDYEFLFSAHPEYPLKNQEYQRAVANYNQEFEAKIEQITDQDELTELYAYYQSLILQLEEDLRTYIIKSLEQHIAEVAEQHQIDIVLVNTVVVYGGVDITKLVVEQMYRAYGISVPSYILQYFE